MLYPVWKVNGNWSVEGAGQIHSQPYFFEEVEDYDSREVKSDVFQARLNHSRFWKRGSVVVRAGILSSAFGSCLPRYDDYVNPMIDMPLSYRLLLSRRDQPRLSGRTSGRDAWPVRSWCPVRELVSSQPAQRSSARSIRELSRRPWVHDKTGFRVGASAHHGPYLSRDYTNFFRGEAKPKDLPAQPLASMRPGEGGHGMCMGNGSISRWTTASSPRTVTRPDTLNSGQCCIRAGTLRQALDIATLTCIRPTGLRDHDWFPPKPILIAQNRLRKSRGVQRYVVHQPIPSQFNWSPRSAQSRWAEINVFTSCNPDQ
jgi:hypothetical protein